MRWGDRAWKWMWEEVGREVKGEYVQSPVYEMPKILIKIF